MYAPNLLLYILTRTIQELPNLRNLQICFPRRGGEGFRAILAQGWYILQAIANLLNYFTHGTELNWQVDRFQGVVYHPHIYTNDWGSEWSDGRAWWVRPQ